MAETQGSSSAVTALITTVEALNSMLGMIKGEEAILTNAPESIKAKATAIVSDLQSLVTMLNNEIKVGSSEEKEKVIEEVKPTLKKIKKKLKK